MAGSRAVPLVLAAVTAMLTSGCGPGDDPVRERWESRQEYPSCGRVTLAQGEEMPEHATGQIACLRRALDAREGAELTISYPTVEGDPVREHYRLTPHGALEVYTDTTDDPNSDRRWSSTDCDRPAWLPEISCP